MSELVVAYTDGACRGNPGPGGWGVWLRVGDQEKKLCGGEKNTTNNRMELMAAIMALRELTPSATVHIYTDSSYVQKGMSEWLPGWKRNQWRTAAKKPVKNADLWQELDSLAQKHQVDWRWVKGHSGDEGNDIADALANEGIEQLF